MFALQVNSGTTNKSRQASAHDRYRRGWRSTPVRHPISARPRLKLEAGDWRGDHGSRLSFRLPQWCSLASGLNTRSTWRFSAFTTPMRACRRRDCTASAPRSPPFRQCGFVLRQLRDVVSRVFQREQLPAVGQNDGIPKRGRPGHAKSFS